MEINQLCSANAIIVAAGNSSRMNMDISKQYIILRDLPVIARTISSFETHPQINKIVLVVNSYHIDYCKKEILEKFGFKKVEHVIAGGTERQQSVMNGLNIIDSSSNIILIHDGARPFITPKIISNCIISADRYLSAVCAVKVKDTIKKSDTSGFILETVERSSLWSIQTPQAFRKDIIIKAHEKAISDNFIGTDDASLVERIGIKPKIIDGSYFNIKITTQEDLIFANAIIDNEIT